MVDLLMIFDIHPFLNQELRNQTQPLLYSEISMQYLHKTLSKRPTSLRLQSTSQLQMSCCYHNCPVLILVAYHIDIQLTNADVDVQVYRSHVFTPKLF